MIIFTNEKIAEEILDLRKAFHFTGVTRIIIPNISGYGLSELQKICSDLTLNHEFNLSSRCEKEHANFLVLSMINEALKITKTKNLFWIDLKRVSKEKIDSLLKNENPLSIGLQDSKSLSDIVFFGGRNSTVRETLRLLIEIHEQSIKQGLFKNILGLSQFLEKEKDKIDIYNYS